MRKTLTALAAAATIAVAATAAPSSAEAHYRGWGPGAVAAGLIGGLALGAIASHAFAGPYYGGPVYYGGPAYYGGPYHYAPRPVYYRSPCYLRRERVWTGWGWQVRRVRVCY